MLYPYEFKLTTLRDNHVNIYNYHFILNSNLHLNPTQLNLSQNFYSLKIKNTLSISTIPYVDTNIDNYNHGLEKDEIFSFIKSIPFINFFKLNQIDVPSCFKKSSSLKRKHDLKPVIKFSNYIMHKGLKLTCLKGLVRAINTATQPLCSFNTFTSWKNLFLFFSLNTLTNYRYNKFHIKSPDNNDDESSYKNIDDFSNNYGMEKVFFKKLSKFKPIFLFYIYKVDKSIFKNSRGRSGKFTFIWKYVASYKRLNIVYHWINKELKTVNKRNFQERLDFMVSQVIFHPQHTWVHRIRKFSYNYVYYNCRNTLAKTYRTTTR